MCPENLWGNLTVDENVRTPMQILKEQAAKLGEITSNLLEGSISKPESLYSNDSFTVDFSIVVPTMNYYRISILRLEYNIKNIYPVKLENLLSDSYPKEIYESNNEQDFKKSLQSILSSTESQKVINSLLTYAKAG